MTFFVDLLQAFREAGSRAQTLIYPWVFMLFSVLALCTLLLAIAQGLETQKLGKALGSWGLKMLALGWVIARWEWLFTLVVRQGIDMGLYMGGDRLPRLTFLNPGAFYGMGLDIALPLLQAFDTSAITNAVQIALSPVLTVSYFLAWWAFCLGFFLLGLVMFMIQIEQTFAIPTLLVLLPFLLCPQTAWIGQGTVTYVVKLAFRFLMLALIAAVVFPVVETITLTTPDVRQALMLVCAAITFVVLFLRGSKMAGNILSGALSLGGGDLATAGLLVAHTLTAGKTLAVEGARRSWNAAGNVLETATAGRVSLPQIAPPRPTPTQLHTTLTQAGRAFHG